MHKTLISLAAVMATLAMPALAKDYILAPARPDKLVVVDTEKMAVEKVITIKDAGPTPMVPVVAPGGKIAYTSVNKTESIVKLDLATGAWGCGWCQNPGCRDPRARANRPETPSRRGSGPRR